MTEEVLFAAALEKRSPADRQAFLDSACGQDAALRARVQLLLDADARSHGILEHRAQIVFCERIALLRCGTIVGQSTFVIARHAPLMLIHAAQLSLSGSEALVRGLAILEQSLTVVLGNAEAAIIVVR